MLFERVGDKAVEMCSPLAFISWLSHLVRSEQAPVLSERVRGRVLENTTSTSRSAFILRFPRVINSLMYGHVHTMRISLRNYDSTLGALPLGRYHNGRV